jgi:hypothetical protein
LTGPSPVGLPDGRQGTPARGSLLVKRRAVRRGERYTEPVMNPRVPAAADAGIPLFGDAIHRHRANRACAAGGCAIVSRGRNESNGLA